MPRISLATLCSRPDCALPRKHREGCDNTDNLIEGGCRGCLPAQAADGLLLCPLHADRIAEDAFNAARLHTDLELQLRRQGRGEYTSGSRDRSSMPNEKVMDARRQIATVLAGMAELMVWERGFTPPDVRGSAVRTRDTTSADARARLEDLNVGGQSAIATTKRTATDVEVLAAYIVQHHLWFAAHTDAGKHSKRLHDAVGRDVWSLAYPSRARDHQEIGTCPLIVTVWDDGNLTEEVCAGRVVWYPEQSALAYCDGCDQEETIEWWRLQIMGNPNAVIDTVAAAAWLSDKWRRPVLASQIANWASRGKLPRLAETVEGEKDPVPVKDARGRQLYRLDELEACAAKMFGPPAAANSKQVKV